MKSAYERAMERFGQNDDVQPLSDAQRTQLAEIDQKFQAKLAEREIFLKRQITAARNAGDFGETEQLETQLKNERIRLNEEREAAKDKIRQGGA